MDVPVETVADTKKSHPVLLLVTCVDDLITGTFCASDRASVIFSAGPWWLMVDTTLLAWVA